MSPDSPETRIGRLEQQVAALKQQLEDVVKDVETLDAARMAIVETKVVLRHVEEEIASLRTSIADDRAAAKKRGEALAAEIKGMREEREESDKESRRQLRLTAVGLATTFITVGGGIVTAIITQGS